jgi:hypothetical protein
VQASTLAVAPDHKLDVRIIRAKVGLLELAKQFGNVSQACRMRGTAVTAFIVFKELYAKSGELALQEIIRRKSIVTVGIGDLGTRGMTIWAAIRYARMMLR